MTLTELLTLNNKLSVSYLQKAYFDIVGKIKLKPTILPVMFSRCKIDGFTYKAYTSIGSEVAIKQIVNFLHCDHSDTGTNQSIIPMTIYDIEDTDYGITSFSDVNDEQETTPSIYHEQEIIECTNIDECFAYLNCYIYPYFVRYSTPYTDIHYYDIQDMVDAYGADNLTVDSLLLMPVVVKAIAIYYAECGMMNEASQHDAFVIGYINLINQRFDDRLVSTYGTRGVAIDTII